MPKGLHQRATLSLNERTSVSTSLSLKRPAKGRMLLSSQRSQRAQPAVNRELTGSQHLMGADDEVRRRRRFHSRTPSLKPWPE